jgi:hypothetical protein
MMDLQNKRLIAFGTLGGLLGFFYSCMYLILYYGPDYYPPVSDAARSSVALQATTFIFITLIGTFFVVYNRHAIMEAFRTADDLE